MKVGDKKQAMILGTIAVLSVGMLGKTALGSFASPNSNQQIPVHDLGGSPASDRVVIPQAEGASPEQPARSAPQNSVATKENTAVIMRDAFAKPSEPEKPKPKPQVIKPRFTNSNPETQRDSVTPLAPTGDFNIGPDDTQKALPGAKPVESSTPKGEAGKDTVKPKPGITVRFDGYVDAGSPMGIISWGGRSLSVQVGETFGEGFRIESITNEHIKIRKAKSVKTILIGKETQF